MENSLKQPLRRNSTFMIVLFVLRICLEFRNSCFEFVAKLSHANATWTGSSGTDKAKASSFSRGVTETAAQRGADIPVRSNVRLPGVQNPPIPNNLLRMQAWTDRQFQSHPFSRASELKILYSR